MTEATVTVPRVVVTGIANMIMVVIMMVVIVVVAVTAVTWGTRHNRPHS